MTELERLKKQLELEIEKRSELEKELNLVKSTSFPEQDMLLMDENPNPVFRFSNRGRVLIYYNYPGKILLETIEKKENEQAYKQWEKIIKKYQANKEQETEELYIGSKCYLITSVYLNDKNYKNIYATEITYIKQIENALRESELKFKHFIESASDIVYNTDANGYFIYVNPVTEKIMGYSKSELEKMHFLSLIHPEYKNWLLEKYTEQFQKKIPSTYYEFPVIRKNGEMIWLGQNVQLNMINQKVTGYSAFSREITDRIHSQEQLKMLNLHLSSIITNMNAGIKLEDTNRRVVLANDTFCKMFDYPYDAKDVVGMDCREAIIQIKDKFADGDKEILDIEMCIQHQEKKLGIEVLMQDGRILERDYIPIFLDGNYAGHLWKYTDVTERKKSQQQLIQSEEKYRRIIQNMNLGLLVVDENDVITDANPNFCKMTGYTKEQIMGWPSADIFLTQESKKIIEEASNLRKHGISNAYELPVKGKDGKDIWMLVSGSPVYDSNNHLIGSIGIHLDITERKKHEAELKEAQLKAEQSAHSKEIFLANMSHEIRTPMNAIIGMAKLLEGANLNQKEKSFLDAIKKSSNNLLVIINDILDFSKIDQGKLQLDNVPFSFSEIINNLMLQFEFMASEKNIFLDEEIDPMIQDIFIGDPTRLSQILINLIGNSIKFTNEGSVSLHCELEEQDDKSQKIKFTIRDTGIGIDKEKIETIFDSFIQEDNSISRKYGGTGLGLSISKQLISLFGGNLDVTSEKGKGSTFSFTINLDKGNEQDFIDTHTQYIDQNILKGLKILLVEDNKMNQFLATTILEQYQIHVNVANNGEEAVNALLSSESFDLILMDIQMPVMDGIEATGIIRGKLKVKAPIIALTANAIKGDKEKYLKAGMNDYVSKPFNQDELLGKISKLMSGKNINQQFLINEENMKEYNLKKLLEQTFNNEEFAKKMVELFIETAEEAIMNINQALAENNITIVKSIAHKIKPSIDTLEVNSLKNLVREIEKTEENTYNKDTFEHQIQFFLKKLEQVIQQMRENELK